MIEEKPDERVEIVVKQEVRSSSLEMTVMRNFFDVRNGGLSRFLRSGRLARPDWFFKTYRLRSRDFGVVVQSRLIFH